MMDFKRSDALAIFFFILLTHTKSIEAKEPKILIIGAGASGIAAASRLFQEGFKDVTILEAEDRIGGRIHTVKFEGCNVDLGAQWVHGEEDNISFELAEPLGLLEKSDKPDGGIRSTYQDSAGNQLNETLNNMLLNFTTKFLWVPKNNMDAFKNITSHGEFVKDRFEIELNDTPLNSMRESILHQLELLHVSEMGADSWQEIPLHDMDGEDCAGDQVVNWKELGYSKILDILMKKYPNPKDELPILANTKLNSEVSKIDWSGESIDVTLLNGENFTADHVVITTSLGVLKEKHATLFQPSLPSSKINVIKNLKFAVVDKILLWFDEPFWNVNDARILMNSFLWTGEDMTALKKDPEKNWTLGVHGAMSIEHKPNLLLLWAPGKYAKMMESLPEEKVFNHTAELIQKFFGRNYRVTVPSKMIRTRWFNNPNFRGTWSFKSIENFEENISRKELGEPVVTDDLKLLFAGEATNFVHPSTVHGAIDSGYAAANRLIEKYRTKDS